MADLIERQEAIDVLTEYGNGRAVYIGVEEAVRRIEQLSSAQPDTTCKRPEGVWEPLGHRMGFLKHPDSKEYKCSICGYESYTLYGFPPKTCPECGADMRKSIKKLYDDMMSVPLPGREEEDG